MLDTSPEICINYLSTCMDSDLAFCNSYEDGTSTNGEPHQAYITAEVGHSQLWAQPWVKLAYTSVDMIRSDGVCFVCVENTEHGTIALLYQGEPQRS